MNKFAFTLCNSSDGYSDVAYRVIVIADKA